MTELRRIFEEALRLERDGEQGVLVTLVDAGGSTPRHDIARMIVRTDGSIVGTIGGGQLEFEAMKRAKRVLDKGGAELVSIDLKAIGMTCGGHVQILLEPIGASPRLVIFGAGHVAAEISPLATRCGFVVMVVDDRPEFASPERFPDARLLVHSFSPDDWNILHLDRRTYAVVVTRGHKNDQDVVEALLDRDLAYLGMMGSKKKVAEVKGNLLAKGISGKKFEHLHSPIGLEINSETPAEIAVSIVGELIQVRRGASS